VKMSNLRGTELEVVGVSVIANDYHEKCLVT
jgi:hypothetical protein